MKGKTVGIVLALSLLPLAAWAQSTTPQKPDDAASASAEARQKVRAACAGDIEKFCANVERAKGAIRSCLESNAAQLSEICKVARAERAAAKAAHSAAK